MTQRCFALCVGSLIGCLLFTSPKFTGVCLAGVGDPTLQTDHPHYPGEGAIQTIEDCVRYATQGKNDEQAQAIALYLWILSHQWHLATPEEWYVPGEVPDTARGKQDLQVRDANRARFSYGYGLCGSVHAWNEPYWKALGFNARRRAFPGHTNSEIEYGGSWHAFDTDMAGLVFRNDGVVAGYEDIIRDPSLVKQSRPPLPCYPFAWPSDFNGMKKGWQQVSSGGNWYKMYNCGYAAHPGIVQLRRGETFTRWFDRDHYGGPSKRRFWHNMAGGPFRDWTFVNHGTPEHREKSSNSRGNASYCNGEFVYRPNLSGKHVLGDVVASANVTQQNDSPRLMSKDGKMANVVFRHFSPYVICGDPVDDANPMSGSATDGFVVQGSTNGKVELDISVDQGQSWQHVGAIEGQFRQDLTEQVKGRYGWQARFRFAGKAGLAEVQFVTITQVCQAIYPRLKPGGSTVTYRAASQEVIPVLPNFGLGEEDLSKFEVQELRSSNLTYAPRNRNSRSVYRTTNNKPASVVFRVDGRGSDLTEVRAAAQYTVRAPAPEGCDYHMEISTDGGKTWKKFAESEVPSDNEYSSGWMYGMADVASAKASEALVRVHFYQGGYTVGLVDAQFYGVNRAAAPQAAVITYGWKEGKAKKSHTEMISAGTATHKFTVPTGEKITDDFVRIEVP